MARGEDGDKLSAADEAFCRLAANLEEERPGTCRAIWHWAKFLPAVLLLLPARFLSLWAILLLMWLIAKLSDCLGCGSGAERVGEPHTRLQRLLLGVVGFLSRGLLFVCGFVWIRESGRRRGRRHPLPAPTVVANHVAMVDVFVLNWILRGKQTAVGAEWLKKVPLIGGIAKAYHVVHVPAGAGRASKVAPEPGSDGEGAQSSPPASPGAPPRSPSWSPAAEPPSPEATSSAPKPSPSLLAPQPSPTLQERGRVSTAASNVIADYQRMRQDNPLLFPLVIFPEGTTKSEHTLVKFRRGAFVSGLPVQPVVFRYPHRFRDISWVQSSSMGNLFRILTQWANWVEVEWLDVYSPSEAERQDPDLYSANVQAVIAKAMNLPPERSSRTVDNVRLMRYRRQMRARRRSTDGKGDGDEAPKSATLSPGH